MSEDENPFPYMAPATTDELLMRLRKVWDQATAGGYRCLEEPQICKAAAEEIERLMNTAAGHRT